MRLHIFQDSFVVEPTRGSSGSTLRIDRQTGEYTRLLLGEQDTDLTQAYSQYIYGIFGVIKLLRCKYLIVITDNVKVATINGCDIRKVTGFNVYPFSASNIGVDLRTKALREDEAKYLDLLDIALKTGTFYFSTDYDLTHSRQRLAELRDSESLSAQGMWKRADERFYWNKFLQEDLIENGMDEWALPVINGYVFSEKLSLSGHNVRYCLISRRSWKRVGKRYTLRGLDMDGNAANFVETEQLVIVPDVKSNVTKVFSFVQTRGSIPLIWQQTVNTKYLPKIEILGQGTGDTTKAFSAHVKEQKSLYGRQVLVSLVNLKGVELKLSDAFGQEVTTANDSNLRFVAWDFHKECKGMKYQNIAKLVDIIKDEFDGMGYFLEDVGTSVDDELENAPRNAIKVKSRQHAVFRTNCMDCLDRTNVVQSVFARRVLSEQLKVAGLLEEGADPLAFFPSTSFEKMFKNVWANNADAMSKPYSGTGAQKTDYTRTGKRTKTGAIRDLSFSAIRYFKNNYRDGDVQDGLDLMLGFAKPAKDSSPFQSRKPQKSVGFLFLKTFVAMAILLAVWSTIGPTMGIWSPGKVAVGLIMLLVWPVLTFKMLNGSSEAYVNRPRLGRFEQFAHLQPHGSAIPRKSKKQD